MMMRLFNINFSIFLYISVCFCQPDEFSFNASPVQAFIFFDSVTINNDLVGSEDWGAFNGEICVGARVWDTSVCNNGVCDVPVLGKDGTNYTVNFMQNDDIPTFKIYDISADSMYNTIAYDSTGTTIEIKPWHNFGSQFIEKLKATTSVPCQ